MATLLRPTRLSLRSRVGDALQQPQPTAMPANTASMRKPTGRSSSDDESKVSSRIRTPASQARPPKDTANPLVLCDMAD
jgi:hypothetical protein